MFFSPSHATPCWEGIFLMQLYYSHQNSFQAICALYRLNSQPQSQKLIIVIKIIIMII